MDTLVINIIPIQSLLPILFILKTLLISSLLGPLKIKPFLRDGLLDFLLDLAREIDWILGRLIERKC